MVVKYEEAGPVPGAVEEQLPGMGAALGGS